MYFGKIVIILICAIRAGFLSLIGWSNVNYDWFILSTTNAINNKWNNRPIKLTEDGADP